MSMRDKIFAVLPPDIGSMARRRSISANIIEILPDYDAQQARIDKLTTELAAIEFALDGQDPSEHADLKLARLKGSRIRAALKGSDT